MYSLGIDVGSSNVKVVMVDDDGRVVCSATRPLTTYRAGQAVTQDADRLWAAVTEAVQQVTAEDRSAAARIVTIGVCSQYSSVVGVNSVGQVTGPILMYLDTRGADHCWEILGRESTAFEIFVERHGIPPIGAGLTLSHLLHLQHDEPEVHNATATYLEVMDFINLRLTGRAVATQCTMFASQLCDNRIVGTTSYDDDLIELSGVDRTRLPALVEIDGVVGQIRSEVASELRVPATTTVRTAMNDTQAAAFATGVLQEARPDSRHRCGVFIGTTGVVIDSAPGHLVDLEKEVLTMPSQVVGRHLVMAENGIAGRAVEHVLSLLCPDTSGFDELSSALERSAPGSGGLLFLPWLAGSMSPSANDKMRGGFLGMSLSTSREDLFRSAVEGTAFNLGWLLPAVESLTGTRCEEIVFGGGGARNDAYAKVLADVLDRPVSILDRPELGAATAAGAVALHRSLGQDPLEFNPRTHHPVDPDPTTRRIYGAMQKQFELAFEANANICEALNHE